MASNLLDELRKHSCIDIDCNDAAGGPTWAVQTKWNLAIEPIASAVARKFQPFQDMHVHLTSLKKRNNWLTNPASRSFQDFEPVDSARSSTTVKPCRLDTRSLLAGQE